MKRGILKDTEWTLKPYIDNSYYIQTKAKTARGRGSCPKTINRWHNSPFPNKLTRTSTEKQKRPEKPPGYKKVKNKGKNG